jgi:hypothetical protein
MAPLTLALAARPKAKEEPSMLGLMQDWPLLCHRIIDHAALYHAERRVISRSGRCTRPTTPRSAPAP